MIISVWQDTLDTSLFDHIKYLQKPVIMEQNSPSGQWSSLKHGKIICFGDWTASMIKISYINGNHLINKIKFTIYFQVWKKNH